MAINYIGYLREDFENNRKSKFFGSNLTDTSGLRGATAYKYGANLPQKLKAGATVTMHKAFRVGFKNMPQGLDNYLCGKASLGTFRAPPSLLAVLVHRDSHKATSTRIPPARPPPVRS